MVITKTYKKFSARKKILKTKQTFCYKQSFFFMVNNPNHSNIYISSYSYLFNFFVCLKLKVNERKKTN